MDWRVFLATFTTIFLAELGDKTQLAAISLVAKSRSPLAVFAGAMLAFAIVTLVGVALGEIIVRIIPANFIKICAGILFIIIGALVLIGRL